MNLGDHIRSRLDMLLSTREPSFHQASFRLQLAHTTRVPKHHANMVARQLSDPAADEVVLKAWSYRLADPAPVTPSSPQGMMLLSME